MLLIVQWSLLQVTDRVRLSWLHDEYNCVQKVAETPEEKMARLKKEANEQEERAKIQMESSRASLQARREREQQYSKLNSIKIHNQWRKIMRMAKVDELRGQIEILSQNHEREVDRKDAIIQMLDRDLDDAEAQFETAVQGNLQVRASFHFCRHRSVRCMVNMSAPGSDTCWILNLVG